MNVIKTIENQSEFVFIYKDEVLPELRKELGDVKIKDKTINKVLERVLNTDIFSYSINERQIILDKKEQVSIVKFQSRTISGTITDANGVPVAGVTIVVDGTNRGVVSDFDGNYAIKAEKGEVLKMSFIGLETKFITVGASDTIDVVMSEDVESLDAVVVTGYQKIDRKLFTGSASTVKLEDVKLEGVPDVARALQGQVAGVEIENASGTFGDGSSN
ncbi:putative outer membrane protein [Algibacter lectus]|uniref:Putative outer membrane protein n=2 Tax=Algibacter lectus TaxID=221126 RepID=A0A090WV24_9FLAO|nr:putative outer membrane protein [Algibacter lectus]